MESITRVLTAVSASSGDNYVYKEGGILRGFCIDLWKEIAKDLNISYSLKAVSWGKMLRAFRNESADIIVQRIDDNRMGRANISR